MEGRSNVAYAEAPSRIVVFGGLNADLVITVPRLPRPAESVMGERLRTFAGGKGANQAVAAARLGGTVHMVGRVGHDGFGEMLIHSLAADGVDTSGIAQDLDEPTGAALIFVEDGGQNMIAVAPGANFTVGPPDADRVAERLDAGALLLVQLEVPMPAIEAAIQAARRAGTRVILNAAPAMADLPVALLQGVDVLVVNEVEAASLFGQPVGSLEEAAAAGLAALDIGAAAAIVTMGEAGAIVVNADGAAPIAAYPVVAVDATAAGDAFVGALAVALGRGADLVSAAHLGAAAGAAAASRLGAQTSLPRSDELQALLDTQGRV